MEFVFSGEAPVGRECRRLLMKEVEGAISHLSDFKESPDLAIHETRKHSKRIRAIFLLSRPVMDSGDISQANRLIRDASRLFSEARDAWVLQETCDTLAERVSKEAAEKSAFASVRARLAKKHRHILKDKSFHERVRNASEDFSEAGHLAEAWDWDRVGYDVVFSAVVSNYRLGLADCEKARVSRDPDDCHEWRKRAKCLFYHLSMLSFLAPDEFEPRALAAEELASWLGEHHDLAVLEEAIGDGSDFEISAKEADRLIGFAETRRRELEEAAFERGAQVYRESPEELHVRFSDGVSAQV